MWHPWRVSFPRNVVFRDQPYVRSDEKEMRSGSAVFLVGTLESLQLLGLNLNQLWHHD